MGVTAQRKGDRERRRTDIRRRLLKVVQKLMADGTAYSNVTIEQLASEAGLSRATFYIYFENKGDLLRVWFTETLNELSDASKSWLAIDAMASKSDFRSALARIIDTYHERATLMAAVLDEATQDGLLRDQLSDAIQLAIKALQSHIETGQRDGWVDPALLAAETASWSVWMLERGLNQIMPSASDEEAAALADTLTDMAWHVLCTATPAANETGV